MTTRLDISLIFRDPNGSVTKAEAPSCVGSGVDCVTEIETGIGSCKGVVIIAGIVCETAAVYVVT